MKGPWGIFTTSVIDGKKLYQVGRIRDTRQPVHSSSVEWYGICSTDKKMLQMDVDWLNSSEKQYGVETEGKQKDMRHLCWGPQSGNQQHTVPYSPEEKKNAAPKERRKTLLDRKTFYQGLLLNWAGTSCIINGPRLETGLFYSSMVVLVFLFCWVFWQAFCDSR